MELLPSRCTETVNVYEISFQNIRQGSRTFGTVSYTHLDVYKRQDKVGSMKLVSPQIDKMIGYSPSAAAYLIHYIAVVAVTFQHYHLID